MTGRRPTGQCSAGATVAFMLIFTHLYRSAGTVWRNRFVRLRENGDAAGLPLPRVEASLCVRQSGRRLRNRWATLFVSASKSCSGIATNPPETPVQVRRRNDVRGLKRSQEASRQLVRRRARRARDQAARAGGVLSGLAASWLKAFSEPRLQAVAESILPPSPAQKLEVGADPSGHPQNMPPAVIVGRVASALGYAGLSDAQRVSAQRVIHYALGAGLGVAYTGVASRWPAATRGARHSGRTGDLRGHSWLGPPGARNPAPPVAARPFGGRVGGDLARGLRRGAREREARTRSVPVSAPAAEPRVGRGGVRGLEGKNLLVTGGSSGYRAGDRRPVRSSRRQCRDQLPDVARRGRRDRGASARVYGHGPAAGRPRRAGQRRCLL